MDNTSGNIFDPVITNDGQTNGLTNGQGQINDQTGSGNGSDNINIFDNILGTSDDPRDIYDNILFLSLAIPMILVTVLYRSGTIENIPCGNNIVSNVSRNFIHVDISHLVGNLAVFFI